MNNENLKKHLDVLSKSRIYFGHQSVGADILKGLKEINEQTPDITLNIINTKNSADLPESYLLESYIGTNTNPQSKCQSFREILNQLESIPLDIVLMKFCYIDFNPQSVVQSIFELYSQTISTIKEQYPHLTIVHVTAPLESNPGWLKSVLKQVLGKGNPTLYANIKRNQFNEMLREHYRDEPLFDLARVESTFPDGRRCSFEVDGQTYYALVPEYTYDGGHLNEMGRKMAARELVRVLADVLGKEKREIRK